jgi:RNA polymerase sigma-70 factor (ECF subfamily)
MKSPRLKSDTDRSQVDSLILAAVSNDRSALEKLARICLPRVRRTVIFSYGSGPNCEDLVQTAMIRIFTRLESFRFEASFFIWVDRITINIVRDSFKKRKFLLFFEDVTQLEVSEESTPARPDEEVEKHRLLRRLSMHFASISPNRRLPLVLSLYQGYTVPEIAALLDLSFDTAKMRLRRGRSDLLKRIKKDAYCAEAIRELSR